jgi:hypothetical protein
MRAPLKLSTRLIIPAAAVLALVTGCATSNPTIDTADEAGMSYDGLYPVKGGTADYAWARPGVDISQYSKIMLQGVGIEYRPGGETGRLYRPNSGTDHYEVSDRQKAAFKELLREGFLEELGKSEHFTIVSEPGPDVLLIRGQLLDVVSFVPPDPIGRAEIYLSRVGEATLVLEIRESTTDAILVRAVDRRAAEDLAQGFTESNRVQNRSEIRRLIRVWANLLRERLDTFGAPAE